MLVACLCVYLEAAKYDIMYLRNQPVAMNAGKQSQELLEAILNYRVVRRIGAIDMAVNEKDPKVRRAFKPLLLHVLRIDPLMPPKRAPFNGEETDYSPKRVSLRILAEWAEEEMIPLFLDNILELCPYRCPSVGMQQKPSAFPSTIGLIRIGKPAMEPCLIMLTKIKRGLNTFNPLDSDIAIQLNILFVIHKVMGKERAIKIIEDEIDKLKNDNPEAAKCLQNALKYCRENEIEKMG